MHVHVRDPETGEPAFKRELFAEVLEHVRSAGDMLINFTTSSFNIKSDNINETRLMPLSLGPDLCSLDVGSLNFRGKVFVNPPAWVDKAAIRMRNAGIKPEMELFELGHIRQAVDMIKRRLLDSPPYFQICLGIPWGAQADLETLMAFKTRLPRECQWSVLGTGKEQLPITTHAMLLGGHVRVGFEDNIYSSKGVPAKTNALFVERTVKLARILQREVATCQETRAILGI